MYNAWVRGAEYSDYDEFKFDKLRHGVEHIRFKIRNRTTGLFHNGPKTIDGKFWGMFGYTWKYKHQMHVFLKKQIDALGAIPREFEIVPVEAMIRHELAVNARIYWNTIIMNVGDREQEINRKGKKGQLWLPGIK